MATTKTITKAELDEVLAYEAKAESLSFRARLANTIKELYERLEACVNGDSKAFGNAEIWLAKFEGKAGNWNFQADEAETYECPCCHQPKLCREGHHWKCCNLRCSLSTVYQE